MPTKKIKVNTISQQAYSILKKAILDGDYGPGYWLQEKELAKELGVSRSPIREALKQLSADGLVDDIPNKGTFVKEFSTKEIIEVYEVREMLERYAIEHLDGKIGKEQEEKLKAYREEFIKYHGEGDVDKYIDADSRFHRYLVECTDNSVLFEVYRKVRNINKLFRIISWSTQKRIDRFQDDHLKMIDCIIKGDFKTAGKISASHISLAKDTAVGHLEHEEIKD